MTDKTEPTSPDHTREENLSKVAELVERAHLCMLTTMTADGKHVSRPMGLQEAEFDGDLWFFVDDASAKVEQIRLNPSVNVSFSNPKSTEWTSISGTAELVHDKDKAAELWSPILNAWFNDGLDTPGLALLKVRADSAEYWDGPSSRVASMLGMVRAAVTRDSDNYPSFEHDSVEFS